MSLTKVSYSMIAGAVANVLDYGADPNGVSDSLSAFNAAFADASTVYVPEGTYLVTGTVVVPTNKNIFGTGNSSIISGNFAGAVLQFNGIGNAANSDRVFGRDLLVLAGANCTSGIRFDLVIRSRFEGLVVVANATMPVGFAAFRVGAQVYTNSFTSCIADSNVNDNNSYGWWIGNAFNEAANPVAATNNNNFNICYSRKYKQGFFLDSSRGSNLYGCCSEVGSDWGVVIAGGQGNNIYNHWNENTKGIVFTTSQKGNGSGGTTAQAGQYNAVRDTPRFGINFVMESGEWNQVENTLLQSANTIDASCKYAVFKNVTLAAGASIVDNGDASNIEYRFNGYKAYENIYSTGVAQAQGYKLTANGTTVTLENLYNGISLSIPPFNTECVLTDARFRSSGDNAYSLGSSANRWSVVYAGTGTINTSDEREKTFLTIEDAERAAALEIKANLRKFKFNDAVQTKGDDARIHFGVSAQQIGSIMQAHGLDPNKYGFFCYDEWTQQEDEEGNVTLEAGNRYGVRYEELLCFIMAAI